MSVNISLQLHPWRVFHGGDEIRGTVKVDFLNSIEVKNVQLKLVGVSKTQYEQSTGQSSIHHEETHDLVYDVITIFPPPRMDGILTSSKYTMAEGKTLESQFNFTLPFTAHCGDQTSKMSSHFNTSQREQDFASSNHSKYMQNLGKHIQGSILPPTFREKAVLSGKDAEVKYFIKVTVRRPKTMALNIRKAFPINVSIPPPDPFPFDDQVMAVSDMIKLTKPKNGSYMGRLPSMLMPSDSKFDLTFHVAFLRPRFIVRGQSAKLRVLILSDISPSEFKDDTKKASGASISNLKGVIFLKKYELKMESLTAYQCDRSNHKITNTRDLGSSSTSGQIDLADMIPFEDIPANWMFSAYSSKFALDISHLFEEASFADFTPTFQCCNINYRHTLKLLLKFGTTADGWMSTKALLDHHCVIVGAFAREQVQEKLPEYTE